MSVRLGWSCHPWSAADAALLERAAGEAGLDFATIEVVAGPRWSVARTGDLAGLITVEPGWRYSVSAELHKGAALRPSSSNAPQRTTLPRLLERVRDARLRPYLRVDPIAAVQHATREESLLRRTASGTAAPLLGPCPLQPATRDLVRRVVRETAQAEPDGVVLVLPQIDSVSGLPDLPEHPSPALLLAAVCFCSACVETAREADVDDQSAARAVRVRLEQAPWMSREMPWNFADDQDELARFVGAKEAAWRAWLATIPAAIPGIPLWLDAPVQVNGWRPVLTETAASGGRKTSERAEWISQEALLRLKLPLRPMESASLVREIAEYARQGWPLIELDGLESADAPTWEAARQAARFAHRGG